MIVLCFVFLFSGCGIHPDTIKQHPPNTYPASEIIHFYQGPLDHLSSVRYGGCPMYPGCSEYALEVIKKHGALLGWMMTFDRLIRCGNDETRLSPEVWVDGHWRYVDTPEQNDFWWYPDKKSSSILHSKPSEDVDWGISVE